MREVAIRLLTLLCRAIGNYNAGDIPILRYYIERFVRYSELIGEDSLHRKGPNL